MDVRCASSASAKSGAHEAREARKTPGPDLASLGQHLDLKVPAQVPTWADQCAYVMPLSGSGCSDLLSEQKAARPEH